MGPVSKISVMITASSAGLKAGMTQAISSVKGFDASLRSMSSRLLDFRSLLAGISVGALARFVQVQFKALDVLGDVSHKLGIQTQAFQALELAAKKSGLDQDELATSLKFLSDRTIEAANGNEELRASFARLGIDLGKFVDIPLERKFEMLARHMAAVPNEAERIKLALDLLGRGGIESLNTLAEVASKGFGGTFQTAESLGILKNDDDIARVQQTADVIDELTSSLRARGQEMNG